MSNVETIKVVPARYPLRTVGAAVALFVLAVVIQSVAFNPRWEWAVFARWFFDPVILEGVGQTLLLTLIGTALSVVAGSMSTNEAATILLLVDNRSGVQISASEGYSKNIDFGLSGWGIGAGAAGAAGAFTRTPEGKVLMAAFADSYNKMVVALRNYKAQTVKGGLGTGGRLGVQGGSTEAGRGIKK